MTTRSSMVIQDRTVVVRARPLEQQQAVTLAVGVGSRPWKSHFIQSTAVDFALMGPSFSPPRLSTQ